MSEKNIIVTAEEAPVEAQHVRQAAVLLDIKQAIDIVRPSKNYDIPTLLKDFKLLWECHVDNREFHKLRELTDAKNFLLRLEIEHMVAEKGRFDFTGLIPFDNACVQCHGTGERYKFFKQTAVVPCKFCDGGTKVIDCPSCKGTGTFRKWSKDDGGYVGVDCIKCDKDEDGKPTGKKTVKCFKCHGTGDFKKLVIAPKIEETTHCRTCKGRGFVADEPSKKECKIVEHQHREASLGNTVLPASLAEKITGKDEESPSTEETAETK